jgi:hypothetical protein
MEGRIIGAFNASLSESLVRRAIHRIDGIHHVEMHPAQRIAWQNAASPEESTFVPLQDFHWTMAGYPILERSDLAKTIVTFCDETGHELSAILGLAIPVGH